jgi:CRISPR/Cas system-associated protein Csm6
VKDEYDFRGAQRGKFFKKDAVLVPPVRLEPEILQFLLERAQAGGATLDELVNELLRKDIELIEAAS